MHIVFFISLDESSVNTRVNTSRSTLAFFSFFFFFTILLFFAHLPIPLSPLLAHFSSPPLLFSLLSSIRFLCPFPRSSTSLSLSLRLRRLPRGWHAVKSANTCKNDTRLYSTVFYFSSQLFAVNRQPPKNLFGNGHTAALTSTRRLNVRNLASLNSPVTLP